MAQNLILEKEDPKKNVINTRGISKEYINELLELACYIKENKNSFSGILKGKVVAMLFYEASTRTRFSFETAIYKMGGNCITTENATKFSSVSKGETLEDTIKVVHNYADIIVLRHFDDDSAEKAVKVSKVPVINAGSGKIEHPTQALLDIFTIYENFIKLEGMKIALVGDLLRGRTCDSLVYLLSKYKSNVFYFVSPKNCEIKEELRNFLIKNEIEFYEKDDLNEVLSRIDICYMTRIQKERFSDLSEYEKAKGKYVIDKNNVELMKDSAIIMHPLPRVDEISVCVDDNKRAKYFQQAENGLYVRKALLKILVDNN